MQRWILTIPVYVSPLLLLFVLIETSLNNAYPHSDSIGIPLFNCLIFNYPLAICFTSKIGAHRLTNPRIKLWNPRRSALSFFSLVLNVFPIGLLWLALLVIAIRSNSYGSVLVCTAMVFVTGAVRTYAIQDELSESEKVLPDIEVVMTFLCTEEGGRKTPVSSGYRPQFYYNGQDWDAQHTYPNVHQVHPGDTVTAQLKFLSPRYHADKVMVGMEFQIREGRRTVARGRVTRMLYLEENAARAASSS